MFKKPSNKIVASPVPGEGREIAAAPGLVVARVGSQPIAEAGIHYAPGQRLTLSPERASALGAFIVPE